MIESPAKFGILYVDDEEDNLIVFKSSFRRDYKVYTAISAQQGFEILQENDIQVIIADQRMPEVTGTEFLEKIVDEYPDTIRMILTAYSDIEALIDGINKGKIFRYINKPWEKTDLQTILSNAIDTYNLKKENKNLILRLSEANESLEQKVKERTAEINRQKEELQKTLDELKKAQKQLVESEKMASLGSLVAGIAHEINTPVGVGIGAASTLSKKTKQTLERFLSEKITKTDLDAYLQSALTASELILNNLERTGELVQSFKQVSVDQTSEKKRIFSLKSYIGDVIRSLQPKFKNRKVEVLIHIPNDIKVNSYPGVFAQIVTNLIINSLMHAFDNQEKGIITISATSSKGLLEIIYTDNGKGISQKILSKIFDPFFTTNMQDGSGLGLYIIYNLVTQKLQGNISCSSEKGKGVNFEILIPLII